jgi:SAM-dependent methyltransferase
MDLSIERVFQVLDLAVSDLQEHPIDLLNIGDHDGERAYLENARPSYRRTLLDVTKVCAIEKTQNRPIRVLEIGAFLGVVSFSLARLGMQVTALDIPEFMANERLQERYRQFAIRPVAFNLKDYELPFGSGSFDVVIMCETLEHLNFNPLPVIAEINRVLHTDGYLYLALPNLVSLPNRINLLRGRSIHNPISDFAVQLSARANMIVGLHWREYTRSELLEMLSMTGFKCISHVYEMPVRASRLASLLYRLFPTLRPGQNLLAKKNGRAHDVFFLHRDDHGLMVG